MDAKVQLADEANKRRDWSSALALYSQILKNEPRRAEIWVQYGHCLKETGDLAGAISAYTSSLKIEPKCADTYLQLGHAYKVQGTLPAALEAYRTAFDLDPFQHDASKEIVLVERMMLLRGDPPQARHQDAHLVDGEFDVEFYLSGFPDDQKPVDPASHYLWQGSREGRDPTPWFSGWHYLSFNPDVAAAGLNPFVHYCIAGRHELRRMPRLGRITPENLYDAHSYAVTQGPHFEEFDASISVGRRKRAKLLAYYLPQFHATNINNAHWGEGFTEWRNLPRALPRYPGHIQPRIPRDLGCYDLSEGEAMRRQIDMAKAAGLHGFCFYHYWFDGERVLEKPMERLLADPTLDFPFCLMWANENWTRTWDGADKEIILKQSYDPAHDESFVADLARHMVDPRYIRLQGRPLFFIYRPGQIPEARSTIARWRAIFAEQHGLEPLIFHAQGFGDLDPRMFGLDGAIEFPPHKICQDLPAVNGRLPLLEDHYAGTILDYDAMVARSTSEARSDYPLIKTATPTWDNEPRRPGRGMILHGSTPKKFEAWMQYLVGQAAANPVYGEPFVCVNAWNEWAEGAILEPDVHYGAAYLNALSRAIHGVTARGDCPPTKVLVIGHDAHPHGAQMLALNIGKVLPSCFGVEVSFLLLEGGVLRGQYEQIAQTYLADNEESDLSEKLRLLEAGGYRLALTNTTPSGRVAPLLKEHGFATVSLVHELPGLLQSYGLTQSAEMIALHSDHVVFPAEVVRSEFEKFAGPIRGKVDVLPQGLYKEGVRDPATDATGVREELGLAPSSRIVLCVGYADLRKGIDRFVATALSLCSRDRSLVFLWVGARAPETVHWFDPEIEASGLASRIRILGLRDDVERFYAAADVFYLSSREDPFPSVVLEALACGLPVVGHRGCGGCDDLIARHGALVPSGDPQSAAEAIRVFLTKTRRQRDREAARRRAVVDANYRFEDYAFGLLQRLRPDLREVSVVVPNYNYRDFISERLRTVFEQSYPLREILVLDDASPDDSVEVIRETASVFGRKIALHVNDSNTGSPFRQWRKGVELARGEYVWIAEADDLASPSLVERLIERMQASGAALGFCDSAQIDERDQQLGESYKFYINDIEPGAFDRSFDMDGPEFLARYLAVKNVILNVSGVIFRRDALLAAMEAVGDELYEYNVAGDWRLYIEICARGGRVSWIADALNTHRRHQISVTHALKVEKHLGEIERMHKLAAQKCKGYALNLKKQVESYDSARRHLLGVDT